jgi:hypothetical protein
VHLRAPSQKGGGLSRYSTVFNLKKTQHSFCLHPLFLNLSISRVQNFAHNISIPMDKDKNKGVGEWVESWWIM